MATNIGFLNETMKTVRNRLDKVKGFCHATIPTQTLFDCPNKEALNYIRDTVYNEPEKDTIYIGWRFETDGWSMKEVMNKIASVVSHEELHLVLEKLGEHCADLCFDKCVHKTMGTKLKNVDYMGMTPEFEGAA